MILESNIKCEFFISPNHVFFRFLFSMVSMLLLPLNLNLNSLLNVFFWEIISYGFFFFLTWIASF